MLLPAREILDRGAAPGELVVADQHRMPRPARAGLICDMAFRGNMKKRMQKADASGAAFALILGDDELAKGVVGVKDLAEGGQTEVPLSDLHDELSGRLSRMGRGPMSGWTAFAPAADSTDQ